MQQMNILLLLNMSSDSMGGFVVLFILRHLLTWLRFFLLPSFLFGAIRRKLYFIMNSRSFLCSEHLQRQRKQSRTLLFSLDTRRHQHFIDVRLKSQVMFAIHYSWLHKVSSLYLLRLISSLVSRWSYRTVFKIVIKSLEASPCDAIFTLISYRQQQWHGMACGNTMTAASSPWASPALASASYSSQPAATFVVWRGLLSWVKPREKCRGGLCAHLCTWKGQSRGRGIDLLPKAAGS